jgi:hypothetical protein
MTFDGGHMGGFWALSKDLPGTEYVSQINNFLSPGKRGAVK